MTDLIRELRAAASLRDFGLSLSIARRHMARTNPGLVRPRRRIIIPGIDPRRSRRLPPMRLTPTELAHLRLRNGHLTRIEHLAKGCDGGVWYQVRECCTDMAVRMAVQSSEAWSGAAMIDEWCYYVDTAISFNDLPADYADAAPLVEASYASCAACNAVYPCDDGSTPCADCLCYPAGTLMLARYTVAGQTDFSPGGCCAVNYFNGYVFTLQAPLDGVAFAASNPDPWDGGASYADGEAWLLGANIGCDELGPGGSTRYSGQFTGQVGGGANCYAFNLSYGPTLPTTISRCGMVQWTENTNGICAPAPGVSITITLAVLGSPIPCP